MQQYTIKGPSLTRRFKKVLVRIVFLVLGRGFQGASRVDIDIKNEVRDYFPEGFTIMFTVWPEGPSMTLRSTGSTLIYGGSDPIAADLTINFKNLESAFMLFTAQIGTPQAYAEHRIFAKGDLVKVMALVRCLNIVERYLFPALINRRILRRLPSMGIRRHINRMYVYCVAVPFGL